MASEGVLSEELKMMIASIIYCSRKFRVSFEYVLMIR